MKALVYTGPQILDYRQVGEPEPDQAGDEVVIRIDSVGICGSDMHAFLGHDTRRPAPLILGHEAAGVIVGGSEDGRRVAVNPLVNCGDCRYCKGGRINLCCERQIISMPPREGAFAEYLRMPRTNLITVPEDVPFYRAALAEPIACGWHAVKLAMRLSWTPLDEAKTLVIGGGAIGVGAALSLACLGAARTRLVEPNRLRREYLAAQGEIDVYAPEAVDTTAGFDLVIDGVGHAATRAQASRLVSPGGLIVHIGLGGGDAALDVRRMTLQEIGFVGTYTYTPEEFVEVSAAITDGRLGALDWIEERSLADGAAAFADIRAGRVAAPKIVLKP